MLYCNKVIKILGKKLIDCVHELKLVNIRIIFNTGYKVKTNKMIIKSFGKLKIELLVNEFLE